MKSRLLFGVALMALGGWGVSIHAAVMLNGLPGVEKGKPDAPGVSQPEWRSKGADENVNALMWQARDLYREGKLDDALQLIYKAKRKAPFNPDIAAAAAKLLFIQERYEEALDELYLMMETKSRDQEVLRMTGYCLEKLERYKEALDVYTRLGIEVPDRPEPYFFRGAVYFNLNDVDRALEEFEGALRLDPENAAAKEAMGSAWMHAERYEEAIAHYKEAIKANPDFAEAYNSLGTAVFRNGNPAQGMAYVRRAIKMNPGYAQAYNNLAGMYALLEQPDKAIPVLVQSLDVDLFLPATWQNVLLALEDVLKAQLPKDSVEVPPEDIDGMNLARWATRRLGTLTQAETAQRAYYLIYAIRGDSSRPEFFQQLGDVLLTTPFGTLGIKLLEMTAILSPDNQELREQLAVLYQQRHLKESETLIADYQKQLKADPKDAGLHFQYASLLDFRGDLPSAIEHYERVVTIEPTNIVAHLTYSDALYRNRQLDRALDVLLTCFEIDPESIRAWVRLFQVMESMLPTQALEKSLPVPEEEMKPMELAEWHFHQSKVAELREENGWVTAIRHLMQCITIINVKPEYFKAMGDRVKQHFSPRLAVPFYQYASVISDASDKELEAMIAQTRAEAREERLAGNLARARQLHVNSDTRAAIGILEKLAREYPDRPELLYQKAWLMIQLQPVNELTLNIALEQLQQVVEKSGGQPRAVVLQAQARAWHLLGDNDRALRMAVDGVKAAQRENSEELARAILAEAQAYRKAARGP